MTKQPQPPPSLYHLPGPADKVVVSVAEVTAFGDFTAALVDSFETSSPGLGGAASGRIEGAFLEAGEQGFRVLVVSEDDSAQMVGRGGVEWVREEALAAADQARNLCFVCFKMRVCFVLCMFDGWIG